MRLALTDLEQLTGDFHFLRGIFEQFGLAIAQAWDVEHNNDGTHKALTAPSLTLTSPLTVANGGTGLATMTANGVLRASSASALASSGRVTIAEGAVDTTMTIDSESGGLSTLVIDRGGKTMTLRSDGTDLTITAANGNLFLEGPGGGAGGVRSETVYNQTDTDAANVFVQSNGILGRSTSSRRYKTKIRRVSDWRWLLRVTPVEYEGKRAPRTRRFGGCLAEDVATHSPKAYGRPIYAGLDAKGRPDDVSPLTAPMLAALQEHERRLWELERRR